MSLKFFGDILKKEKEALERKEKEFANWSAKVNAEPVKGLKFSNTHLHGGNSSHKLEMPSVPLPGLEGCSATYEFDKKKFEKSMSSDVFNSAGNKVNLNAKWTWTPADSKHVLSLYKVTNTKDLGGFKATISNQVDLTKVWGNDKNEDLKYAHAHGALLKGADWNLAAAIYFNDKGGMTYGAKGNYMLNKKSMVWFTNETAVKGMYGVGGSWENNQWKHLAQAVYHSDNSEGFNKWPVTFQMGHNFKASDDTDLQASVTYGNHLTVHNAVLHKFNKNLSARMHQHFFSEKINTEGAVQVGVELTYNV